MSKVLVEVEATLWARFRGRAVERGLKVPEAMGQALRGWLSFGDGSVGGVTAEQPPAAEVRQRQTTALDAVGSTDPTRGKVTLESLKASGLVTTGRALADGSSFVRPLDTARMTPDPAPAIVVDPREAERQRRAAQDRLRTHPEDEVADPEVDF